MIRLANVHSDKINVNQISNLFIALIRSIDSVLCLLNGYDYDTRFDAYPAASGK